MEKSLFDLSVLLIFFNRPDTLRQVFAAVKKARPAKLFLACDGPRENCPADAQDIALCKQIVEDIDWECAVYKNYASENMGCGMRPQTAITWAFEHTDRLVVLEDDCVPHESFFPYMKEMLDRYKQDTRIGVVSAFNHCLDWDCGGYSYFFAKMGPLAGAWGSWKRVWDQYDYELKSFDDAYLQKLIYNDISFKRARDKKVNTFSRTRSDLQNHKKLDYWDYQFLFLKYAQSYLAVVPKFSLASNVGLGEKSTHGRVAKNPIPSIFFAEDKHLDFPLTHPRFVVCDREYDNFVDGKYTSPNPIKKQVKRAVRFVKRRFK